MIPPPLPSAVHETARLAVVSRLLGRKSDGSAYDKHLYVFVKVVPITFLVTEPGQNQNFGEVVRTDREAEATMRVGTREVVQHVPDLPEQARHL